MPRASRRSPRPWPSSRTAEEIGSCLNGFFGALIDIITSYGGDVLKFSGDAVTILWKVDAGSVEARAEARQRAVLSACSCCESLQRQAQSFGQTPVPGVTLTLHIGVGFGPLKLLQLGGLLDRWEFCAVGQPLEEVAIAEPLAKPGETVVSPTVQEILGSNDIFEFQVCPGDSRHYALLKCERHDLPSDCRQDSRIRSSLRRLERALDARVVQRYVPHAVRRKLWEQSESLILGLEPEMRRVSVIFLSIRGLAPGNGGEEDNVDVERTQLVVQLLQQATYAFEGSVNKFLVDDKGMLLLCAFGLPPLNHYIDDPLRAVLAAARFCDTLAEEGLEGQSGVATGTVWCGTVGSSIRREYTVLGDTVNLSARLMAKTERNTVLVDAETFRSCRSTLAFDPLGAISVKGKKDQVDVYRFTGQLIPRRDRERKGLQASLLSWEEWPAKEELLASLDLQLQNRGGLVLVHGGPGSGKTELAAHVRAWAMEHDLTVLSGQNQSPTGTITVPRLCWQEVFSALLKEARSDPFWNPREGANDREILRRLLSSAGATREVMAWLPVLRLIIPGLYFGPNVANSMVERDVLHALTRPSRVVTLCKMLIDAFSRYSTKSEGTVILLHLRRSTSFFGQSDDYDEDIVEGIMELCENRGNCKPLIFCVVARDAGVPSKALLPRARHLMGEVGVNNLSLDMTEMYVQHMVDAVEGVDPDLLQYIYESSGGNPYGVDAVVSELRHRGTVHVSEGRLEISEGTRLRKEYPEVLIGMALATFEKLPPRYQDLVKNVAVCCQESDSDALNLEDLAETLDYPIEELLQSCRHLVSQGVFRAVMPMTTKMIRSSQEARRGTMTFTPSNSPHNVRCPSDMELSAISFTSQLLLHVVLSLVLHSQKETIRNRIEERPEGPPAHDAPSQHVSEALEPQESDPEPAEPPVVKVVDVGSTVSSRESNAARDEDGMAYVTGGSVAAAAAATANEKDVDAKLVAARDAHEGSGVCFAPWNCCG